MTEGKKYVDMKELQREAKEMKKKERKRPSNIAIQLQTAIGAELRRLLKDEEIFKKSLTCVLCKSTG